MFNIDAKVQEFLRKRDEWRNRVVQACVSCGYGNVTIREWVHAPSGNKHYPTEVRSGEVVLAQMWIEGMDVGSIKDDHVIRFMAQPMFTDVATQFCVCGIRSDSAE